MPFVRHAEDLERLYRRVNRPEMIDPDPLAAVRRYEDPADRQVVGLLASGLAYGRVRQIVRSVDTVLERMGEQPARFAAGATRSRLERTFADFRHRFNTGRDVAGLIRGIGVLLRGHGSLERSFSHAADTARAQGDLRRGKNDSGRATVLPALRVWTGMLQDAAGWRCGFLIPDPARGGACKRLHLYLRWMVRRDAVDPGGWRSPEAAELVVPLDTHMHRIARMLGDWAGRRRRPGGPGGDGRLRQGFPARPGEV